MWKQEFTHWLPLYLNERHAKDLAEHAKQIAALHGGGAFVPEMVFKVLPALLNTMVVSVMSGNTHESLLALTGYTSFFQVRTRRIAVCPR